jgi:very-short-patch-repair endonuclease
MMTGRTTEKMTAKAEKSGCLSILLPFLGRSKSEPISGDLPYRLRDDFLSPAEFSFYKVLSSVVGSRFTVQSKVRLADVFFVARPNENVAYFNRIAQRHLDFLVCDSATMKPLLGIELDDSSHQRDSRQERDEFVDKVFQAARFPLLRFSAQREYNTREIAERIAPFLKDKMVSTSPSQAPSMPPVIAQDNAAPLCPKCNIPMVIRTVAQGEHKGKQFYGCPNYPRCREVKPFAIRKAG